MAGVKTNRIVVPGQFGIEQDGDVTIAAPTTLTADMYYGLLVVNDVLAVDQFTITASKGIIVGPNGRIHCNGNDGSGTTGGAAIATGSANTAGVAGGAGGTNANGTAAASSSNCVTGAQAGGAGGDAGARTGGAGGAVASAAAITVRSMYVNPAPSGRFIAGTWRYGGSGSGGAGEGAGDAGGGGGSQGGRLWLSAPYILNEGIIEALGGNGAAGVSNAAAAGGGGGGSGGGIWLITARLINVGTIRVTGGTGGAGDAGGIAGSNGPDGFIFQPDEA